MDLWTWANVDGAVLKSSLWYSVSGLEWTWIWGAGHAVMSGFWSSKSTQCLAEFKLGRLTATSRCTQCSIRLLISKVSLGVNPLLTELLKLLWPGANSEKHRPLLSNFGWHHSIRWLELILDRLTRLMFFSSRNKHYLCISAPAMPIPPADPTPGPGHYEVVDYGGPAKHYMSGSVFVSSTSRWSGDILSTEDTPGPGNGRFLGATPITFFVPHTAEFKT